MTPIILVCGPSGSGKTSLVDHVLESEELADIRRIRSITTRLPRADKLLQDQGTYEFVDKASFSALISEGSMVEWDEFCGQMYGTSVHEFDTDRIENADALIKVATVDGIEGFRKWLSKPDSPQTFQIFTVLVDADQIALASRLGKRGDDPAILRQRIASSMQEREAYAKIHWDVALDTSYMSLTEAASMFEATVLGILAVCQERSKKWETSREGLT